MHGLVGQCTTGYIGILRNFLGILLSGEMVSGKTLDCYRLALGRTSSSKTLLHCIIWQFLMQFRMKRDGNHQVVEGVPNGRVVVRCEHRQRVSCHIKISESVRGMLPQWEVDPMGWLKWCTDVKLTFAVCNRCYEEVHVLGWLKGKISDVSCSG